MRRTHRERERRSRCEPQRTSRAKVLLTFRIADAAEPDDSAVDIEPGFDAAVYEGLAARGHPLRVARGYERVVVGRATIILRTPDGVLWGASDGRADGCAIGY